MISRTLLTLILSVLSLSVAFAEDDKENMNNIKMDPAYYWGEATSDDNSVAASDALYVLIETIAADNITVTEDQLKGRVEYLYIPRGERIRAFAYIQKSKLSSLPPPAPAKEKPAATPAKPQQPAQTVVQQPSATVTQPQQNAGVDSQSAAATTGSTNMTGVLMTLSQCQQATDALRCLKDYQQNGFIGGCGKVTSKTQLAENNYLVIFDNTMSIKAILAPPDAAGRKNCVTGEMDSPDNYKGCGVIWFR